MHGTRQTAAIIVALALAVISATAAPAHAALKNDQAPLPANCPKGANPNSPASSAIDGAYGEPTNNYLNGGVLTDSGNVGQVEATNVTASLCGNLHIPWWPQVADPVPGSPPIDPNRVEVGGVAPPDNANGTSDAALATTYPGLGATVAVYFVGPTTLVVRQTPRPNGAIDADASTQLVAKATVTLFGQSTPVTCWIGGGPGSTTTADGTKVPAGPANVYLATTTPANFTPPGGQNSGPFTGPLGAARAVLVTQPFTLQSESCSPDLNLPITGSLVSTVFNQLLSPNGARLSVVWNLQLSIA